MLAGFPSPVRAGPNLRPLIRRVILPDMIKKINGLVIGKVQIWPDPPLFFYQMQKIPHDEDILTANIFFIEKRLLNITIRADGLSVNFPRPVRAVVEDCISLFAIPSGPARLLNISLQIRRRSAVNDKADIVLVNAHAKAFGRGHDFTFAGDKVILLAPSFSAP